MIDHFQAIILAFVQGFSEFLPISSSAHLILLPKFLHWQDQGLAFDVMVHLGTLCAVVYYYKTNIGVLCGDFYRSILHTKTVGESKLAWGVLLATIPVGLVGLMFKNFIALELRSFAVIAATTLIFGVILGVADWVNRQNFKPRKSLLWSDITLIGFAQTLALIPGVSRAGITITAALLLGLSRQTSIQFAFLLSIPVISLSAGLLLVDLYQETLPVNWSILLVGFFVSAITAYFTIHFFIKLLAKIGLLPFVVYRILLGIFIFSVFV